MSRRSGASLQLVADPKGSTILITRDGGVVYLQQVARSAENRKKRQRLPERRQGSETENPAGSAVSALLTDAAAA